MEQILNFDLPIYINFNMNLLKQNDSYEKE